VPGLVPPPSPQRKPGEGGFTQAPPTPPLPGFTPSPPSVPVHPGRPAEANKPTIVSQTDGPDKPAAKGPLPPARADERGIRRYNPNVPSHAKAGAAEAELAAKVHGMPDQQVVLWGGPIGSHGADVISVDTRTGAVTLWDAKYRSENVKVGASKTFKADTPARDNAIGQAEKAIENDKTLSPEIREKALKNLGEGKLTTITTGFGNAKNSVIGN
jgi:filamentous hemagglutinin